jgi:Cu+-exporting ATPase
VLVASCPCALGLAVPSVIAISLNLAMKSGVLIRKNAVFEKSKMCNVVAFDKTGTLFTKVEKIEEFKTFPSKYD